MHILHGLTTSTILTLSLSTTLFMSATPTAAKPHCSPKVFTSLPYEFWIEIKFLGPYVDDDARPNYPVHVDRNYMVYSGALYDRPIITRTGQVRDLFLLKDTALLDSDDVPAYLGPDSLAVNGYDGYNPVVFRAYGEFDGFPESLDFTAVEVCTSNYDTELQLRGVIHSTGGECVCFGSSPPCDCENMEGSWEHPLQRTIGEKRDEGTVLCLS